MIPGLSIGREGNMSRQQSFAVTTRSRDPYLHIPLIAIRCPWLSPIQKAVLFSLWSWVDWVSLEGAPTYARLAESSNVAPRSVARTLQELRDLNVISITPLVANGHKRPFYKIHNDIFVEFRQPKKPVDNTHNRVDRMSTPQVDRMSTPMVTNPTIGVDRMSTSTISIKSSLSDVNIDDQILREKDSRNDQLKNNMAAEDLRRLGISEVTISKLVREYTTDQLMDAYHRSKGQGHNPAGYFLTVLRNLNLPFRSA